MADLKQYTQEAFKKAGIPQDKIDAFVQLLGDESVSKAVRDSFVETSQHHSTIDRMKGEFEGRATAAEKRATQWDEWWKQNGATIQAIPEVHTKLKKYEETYGVIDDAASVRQAAQATGLTKAEVEQLLEDRQQRLAAGVSSLMKDVAYVTSDYQQKFKEPLDLDALEQHAAKLNIPLRQAYKDFITPRVEETRNLEFETKLKAAREEAVRDYASKHRLPVESKPRDPHPLFDQKVAEPNLTELQRERRGREAFMEEWNNQQEKATA